MDQRLVAASNLRCRNGLRKNYQPWSKHPTQNCNCSVLCLRSSGSPRNPYAC